MRTARQVLPPQEIPLPEIDPYVFSDFAPQRAPVPHHWLYRQCPAHPGLSWYGPQDCWVCKPGPT